MASSGALAIRLQRGSLIGWTVGFALLGAVTGGVASTSTDLLDGNPQLNEMLARIGGAGAMTDMLLSTMGAIAGLIAAGYAISAALRMSTEETADRVGPVLATAVGRPRWMAGHLAFAVAGPVVLLAAAGVVAGVFNGTQTGDFSHGMTSAFGAMIVQLPAALVLGGLAVALFGWLPRLTSVAWAALVVALLLGQLGALLQLPQWVMDISPFTHIPTVPTQDVRWMPLIVLTGARGRVDRRRGGRFPAPGRQLTARIAARPARSGGCHRVGVREGDRPQRRLRVLAARAGGVGDTENCFRLQIRRRAGRRRDRTSTPWNRVSRPARWPADRTPHRPERRTGRVLFSSAGPSGAAGRKRCAPAACSGSNTCGCRRTSFWTRSPATSSMSNPPSSARLFGGDPRVEEHLQQDVTQFLADGRRIPALHGLDQLVALLDQVPQQRLMSLFRIPRATAGRAQPIHHGHRIEQAAADGPRRRPSSCSGSPPVTARCRRGRPATSTDPRRPAVD